MSGTETLSLSPITSASLKQSNSLLQGCVSQEVIDMMANIGVSFKGDMLYQTSTNEELMDFRGWHSHHLDNQAIYLCVYQDAVTMPWDDAKVLRIWWLDDISKYRHSDISSDLAGKVNIGEKKIVSGREELEKLGFSLPNSSKIAFDEAGPALIEELSTVLPTTLEALLAKFHRNLVKPNTPETRAQEMKDKKEFAKLATAFIEQEGTIAITINNEQVIMGKVEYLDTFTTLALSDKFGKPIERRESATFTFTPKTVSQVKKSVEDTEEVTAAWLSAEWEWIQQDKKNPFLSNFLDEEGHLFAKLDQRINSFISKIEKFLKQWGKIFATTQWSDEKIEVTAAANANGDVVFYSGDIVIGTYVYEEEEIPSRTIPKKIPDWMNITFEDNTN